MAKYVYTHVHFRTYIYIFICTHVCTSLCLYVHAYTFMQRCMCITIDPSIHPHIHPSVHVDRHIYLSLSLSPSSCMHMHLLPSLQHAPARAAACLSSTTATERTGAFDWGAGQTTQALGDSNSSSTSPKGPNTVPVWNQIRRIHARCVFSALILLHSDSGTVSGPCGLFGPCSACRRCVRSSHRQRRPVKRQPHAPYSLTMRDAFATCSCCAPLQEKSFRGLCSSGELVTRLRCRPHTASRPKSVLCS